MQTAAGPRTGRIASVRAQLSEDTSKARSAQEARQWNRAAWVISRRAESVRESYPQCKKAALSPRRHRLQH